MKKGNQGIRIWSPGFKVEANIPVSLLDYLKKNFDSDNVTYEDEYVNVEDLDWFKEFKENQQPTGQDPGYESESILYPC